MNSARENSLSNNCKIQWVQVCRECLVHPVYLEPVPQDHNHLLVLVAVREYPLAQVFLPQLNREQLMRGEVNSANTSRD